MGKQYYQGFALGFTQNFGLVKGLGVAVGGQFLYRSVKNLFFSMKM